ncbi:MAG: DUF3501 family protein [Gammaproteobacteria bacterium]|nr:DUF3501 family protein [Gammaproteobacteria bacterium]
MKKISRDELMPLEQYAKARGDYRARVMAHKKDRQVQIGKNATLYFEDHLTMLYQVQEMLRAERIFEDAGIQDELDAYNPMVPDGTNWKATFMIEFTDVEERRVALEKMIGIEDKVWVQVADFSKVYAIADEDLERETEEKTSSVHFLRFELTADMIRAVKADGAVSMGIDHPAYTHSVMPVPEATRASLAKDLA